MEIIILACTGSFFITLLYFSYLYIYIKITTNTPDDGYLDVSIFIYRSQKNVVPFFFLRSVIEIETSR